MRLTHLARRFAGALVPGRPRPDDLEWAESVLGADAFGLFARQPRHDQRHAIGVARETQRRLAGSDAAGDGRWLSAALLHDIGKLDSRLGVYGRVVATVCGAVAGRQLAGAWSARSGFTRRVGLYLRHPELGADRIRLVGAPEEAARWAAAHHEPATWEDLPIPAPVVEALAAADDD